MVFVRARRAPGRQSGIDSRPFSTRRRVGRRLTLISFQPRTLQITITLLLGFTLGAFAAAVHGFSIIGKRVVIVGGITVVILSHFTFTITFVVRDRYAWSQGLAVCDREICRAAAGLSLANVLADAYLDALVSK